MQRFSTVPLPVLALVAMTACQESAIVDSPSFGTETILADTLPAPLDTTRTYVYRYPAAYPDSLFFALLRADLPVTRAWYPLDNRCMDPVGPRFTAELLQPDERMAAHGFDRGAGRLFCATQLLQFTP